MAPVYDMEIHGDAGGRLDFSAYDSGLRELAWIVESSLMQQELWETVKRQHNVTLICPAAPPPSPSTTRRPPDPRRRSAHRGALVVAADGRDSWVRQAAGIGARNTPYDEKGVVANFRCESPTATPPSSGSARMACWPTCRCPTSRCRWSGRPPTPSPTSSSPCRRSPLRAGRRSRRRAPRQARLVTPAAAFALRLMRVEAVVQPRLALIGDAAHAIHPLRPRHQPGLPGRPRARRAAPACPPGATRASCGAARYARARAEETALLQYTTHGLNRLFKPADPLLSGLRNLG
jgi:2-polyprenyl-6-methoxyphenol hydroxylase-like FAD-dependent oxidoreductase